MVGNVSGVFVLGGIGAALGCLLIPRIVVPANLMHFYSGADTAELDQLEMAYYSSSDTDGDGFSSHGI